MNHRRALSPQTRSSVLASSSVQLRNKIAVELPSDCKPNINDLRQIFDDTQGSRTGNGSAESSKRSSHTERTLLMQQQNNAFFDAKPSHVEENIFESKTRNLEFERAKQKFDNPHHHQHHHHHQRERSSGRFVPNNTQQAANNNNKANLALQLKNTTNGFDDHARSAITLISGGGSGNDGGGAVVGGGTSNTIGSGVGTGQSQSHKKDQPVGGYSRNSINLDGLKVSDDEEVSCGKVL